MAIHLHEPEAVTASVYIQSPDADLKRRIQAEFGELPGMHLSGDQAARLLSIDHARCERILNDLVGSGFLRRDQFDRYTRAHSGH